MKLRFYKIFETRCPFNLKQTDGQRVNLFNYINNKQLKIWIKKCRKKCIFFILKFDEPPTNLSRLSCVARRIYAVIRGDVKK